MTTGRGHTGRLLLGAYVTEGPHNIITKYFPEARANLSRLPPLELNLANGHLQVSHIQHTTLLQLNETQPSLHSGTAIYAGWEAQAQHCYDNALSNAASAPWAVAGRLHLQHARVMRHMSCRAAAPS